MSEPKHTLSGEAPQEGYSSGPAPAQVDPQTGQHQDHWVLPKEERDKGFVRPVRRKYTHVGLKPPVELEDLTPEEVERYADFGYVKHEFYPENESCLTGRFWTQAQLDSLGGCGQVTSMPQEIAETLARNPKFYGKTFCCGCKDYLPVEEFVWDRTAERVGS